MAIVTSTDEIHLDDIGTIFEITLYDEGAIVTQVSSATLKQIKILKPDGTLMAKTAAFKTDGSDGIIQYEAISGDLDTLGSYKIQGYVEMPCGNFHSSIGKFKVHRNLEAATP